MLRSRSSFEDLEAAIASASSLNEDEGDPASPYRGMPLVSFERSPGSVMPPPAPSAEAPRIPPAPRPVSSREVASSREAAPRVPQTDAPGAEEMPPESLRRPPKLPDFTGVVSPVRRCEKIVEWIVEATSAADVFLADASGLPLAGSIADAETRIAGSGLIASAVSQLAAGLPGNTSPLFELHVGEGPFFQLIGFEAGGSLYLVGLTRQNPLTPRQAHAIRLACRHALGEGEDGSA
ncbi:MAG: hypothetical protein U0359_08445 [Byssovorax sp.]